MPQDINNKYASLRKFPSDPLDVNHNKYLNCMERITRHLNLCPIIYAKSANDEANDEKRWKRIFKRLDRNKNGRIDIQDLRIALDDSGLSRQYAEVIHYKSDSVFKYELIFLFLFTQNFIRHSDRNQSGDVSLTEFINYAREHERNLQLQFEMLDRNKDGRPFKKKAKKKNTSPC